MNIRVVLLAFAAASLASAADANFGLIGIAGFETARLTAYCDGSVTPTPCDITFEFHHISGRMLKQATVTLQPGTGGFLDLRWQETGSPARRVEISPCWRVGGGAAVGSLTIVDNFTGLSIAQAYPAALASGAQ